MICKITNQCQLNEIKLGRAEIRLLKIKRVN